MRNGTFAYTASVLTLVNELSGVGIQIVIHRLMFDYQCRSDKYVSFLEA